MKYTFYQEYTEEGSNFNLFWEDQNGQVLGYEFKSDIQAFSKDIGVTRLFGKKIFIDQPEYYMYPLTQKNVDKGDVQILEQTQKFSKFDFGKGGLLEGEYILRHLSNGESLFWKPYPLVPHVQTRNITVSNDGMSKEIEQQFSIFGLTINGENEFEGIAAAEGVWTGKDFHTTLFTDKIIESLAKNMKENMSEQLIDFNHDFKSSGRMTDVDLKEERGIKHIYIKGVADRSIPHGSGLSIIIKSTLKWNSNLNVFVLLSAKSVGVSIITESKPACTICMIR